MWLFHKLEPILAPILVCTRGNPEIRRLFLKHLNFSFVNYHFYGVNIAYWHVYVIYIFQVQAQKVEVM